MPEEDYVWLPRDDILTFEEMAALVDVFTDARRRQGAPDRRRAAAAPGSRPARAPARRASRGSRDLALTTNGVLLAEQARARCARPGSTGSRSASTPCGADRFRRAHPARRRTRGCSRASRRSRQRGLPGLKLDTVVMRGVNDDELADLLEYAARASGPRCASSSTWTWAAPPTGACEQVVPRARCSGAWASATASRSSPSRRTTRRARRALPAARRPRVRDHLLDHRSPSAAPATAAASPPTACGTSASTRRAGWTCAEPLRGGASREALRRLIAVVWQATTRPRRGGAAGPARAAPADPDRRAQARSTPRDAHAGRIGRGGRGRRRPGEGREPAGLRPAAVRAAPGLDRLRRQQAAGGRGGAEPDRGRALPRRQRSLRRGPARAAREPGLLRHLPPGGAGTASRSPRSVTGRS